jgi:hypothetical protein
MPTLPPVSTAGIMRCPANGDLHAPTSAIVPSVCRALKFALRIA